MIGHIESPAPPAGEPNEGPITEVSWKDVAPAGSALQTRRINRAAPRDFEKPVFIGNLKRKECAIKPLSCQGKKLKKHGSSMFSAEWGHRKSVMNARPHPGPLPRGEGEPIAVAGQLARHRCSHCGVGHRPKTGTETECVRIAQIRTTIHPLPGERGGVRADVKSNLLFRPRWMFARRHPLKISKKRKHALPLQISKSFASGWCSGIRFSSLPESL